MDESEDEKRRHLSRVVRDIDDADEVIRSLYLAESRIVICELNGDRGDITAAQLRNYFSVKG